MRIKENQKLSLFPVSPKAIKDQIKKFTSEFSDLTSHLLNA